jgi:small ligand-binding sensory domain FIST
MALRFGTPLLEGLTGDLADCRSMAGAGLIDSLQPGYSHVFTPDGAERDGIAAVAFGGGAQLDSVVVHGCRPAGAYHEITKTMGPVVAGIDGRPALEVIDELLGGAVPREDFGFRVILGVNRGDPFGAFDEENYQTRLCLAVDEAAGGLVMFEPDLEPGDQVQLMRVSTDLSYVGERVAGLLERVDGRTPLLALYADCAGRCMMASPLDEEEGHAVQAALGDIPLLGFYTGVEIGAVKGRVRPLDWTGVLCLLSV